MRQLTRLFAVASAVVLLDQGTKFLAVARLTRAFEPHGKRTLVERLTAFYKLKNLDNDPFIPGEVDRRLPAVDVVPGLWSHKYVENPGAAWGLLGGLDEKVRVPFFHAVSLSAIAFIVLYYRRLQADQRLLAWALALVLGGALGNYADRLARNYVIDFVDWHWRGDPRWHWPTFNLADAAISVGVFLMLVDSLFGRRLRPEDVPALPSSGTTAEGSGLEGVEPAAGRETED